MNKNLIGCIIGNVIEWYDYMIYASLAPLLSKVFFPKENHNTAILLTLSIFAVGFFIRPLGSIVMGHIADMHGRKKALIISMLFIAFSSFGVSLLPTYQSIGLLAPILLLLFRLTQGFSIGGELPSLVTYLAEVAPRYHRTLFCSNISLVGAMGVLLATLVVFTCRHLLGNTAMQAWGWRIPFLLSVFLVIVTTYLRTKLLESSVFLAMKKPYSIPLLEVFRINKKTLFKVFIFASFTAVLFYSYNIFTITYLTHFVGITYQHAFPISLLGICLYTLLIPGFAWLGDKYGQKQVLISAIIALIILIIPIYMLFNTKTIGYVVLGQVIFSLLFTPCLAISPAFMVKQSDVAFRCTTLGLGHSFAMALFGGTAPMLNVFLIEHFNTNLMPGYYVLLASLVGLIACILMKKEM